MHFGGGVLTEFSWFMALAGNETDQRDRCREKGKPAEEGAHRGHITHPQGKGARGKQWDGSGEFPTGSSEKLLVFRNGRAAAG